MKVNYIREMTAWFEFVLDEEPSGSAQLLWHALMSIFNRRGDGENWPEEIRISNQKLLCFLPFGEDTLNKARSELISLGRILYTSGNRGERPCYQLCLFNVDKSDLSTDQEDTTAVNPSFNPEINPTDNPKKSGQMSELSQTLNVHAYEKPSSSSEAIRLTVIQGKRDDDDDDVGDIMLAWRESIGPDRLPIQAALDLAKDAKSRGMPGAAAEAIREAARNGARSPVRYAHTILEDWQQNGRSKNQIPKGSPCDYLRRNYTADEYRAMETSLDAEADRWSN